MVLYMITNDYENQHKLLSLSNVLQYHDVNMVLCNDILDVDYAMELQNMDYLMDTDNVKTWISEYANDDFLMDFFDYDDNKHNIDNLTDDDLQLVKDDYYMDIINDLELSHDDDNIYQYFIIDDYSSDLFIKLGYPVFYSNVLNVYVVGITHLGTSWNYILTNQTFDDYGVTSE